MSHVRSWMTAVVGALVLFACDEHAGEPLTGHVSALDAELKATRTAFQDHGPRVHAAATTTLVGTEENAFHPVALAHHGTMKGHVEGMAMCRHTKDDRAPPTSGSENALAAIEAAIHAHFTAMSGAHDVATATTTEDAFQANMATLFDELEKAADAIAKVASEFSCEASDDHHDGQAHAH